MDPPNLSVLNFSSSNVGSRPHDSNNYGKNSLTHKKFDKRIVVMPFFIKTLPFLLLAEMLTKYQSEEKAVLFATKYSHSPKNVCLTTNI
jgi:hypothetical protein